MKKKGLLALILTGVMTASLFAGCGSSGSDKKEGSNETLTVYCGVMEDYMVKAMSEFEKKTGIKAEAVRMSSGEVLGRIRAEKDNPKASVWFGGPADGFVQAAKEGLLEKYVSPNSEKVPTKFKDKDGLWTGIYVGYLGFCSNKKLLEEKGLKAPTSWEDLLNPDFKGQISTANPGSSGTAYTMLATIVQLMGEEKGLDYMKKLNENVKSYEKSGTAPARMAGQGEVMVGISFLHDAIKYREEGLKDLVLTAPKEGTGYEVGGVGILKGSPNQEAAKKFVDFALSKQGQEIGATVGSYQFLTNKDAKTPKQAEEIKDTKLIDYKLDWAGSHRNELVEKWNKAIKNK